MSRQIPQVAYRLRDYEFSIFLKDHLAQPVPLAGTTWTFTLRREALNGDNPVLLSGTTAGGEVTIADAPGGELAIAFLAADMDFVGGMVVAEILQTDAGLKMSGRWHCYVGDEDEVPLSTVDVTTIGSQSQVIYAYDSLLLGALNPGNDLVALTFLFDGGASPAAVGSKVWLRVPFNCTLMDNMLMADIPTTAIVDVWKDNSSAFPPTLGDSITASDKPTLANAVRTVDADVSTWSRAIAAGDVLMAVIQSNDVATKLNLSLTVKKALDP